MERVRVRVCVHVVKCTIYAPKVQSSYYLVLFKVQCFLITRSLIFHCSLSKCIKYLGFGMYTKYFI